MVVDSITKKNSKINGLLECIYLRPFFFRKKKEGRLPHVLSKKAQTLRGIK
jgi:hypothetical protein